MLLVAGLGRNNDPLDLELDITGTGVVGRRPCVRGRRRLAPTGTDTQFHLEDRVPRGPTGRSIRWGGRGTLLRTLRTPTDLRSRR